MCNRNFARDSLIWVRGWAWFSANEAQRPGKAIPAAINGGDLYRVCLPRGVERVDLEGIKNAVEMQDDCLLDFRHARTVLRRSDDLDLYPLPGDDPSRFYPPRVYRVPPTPPTHLSQQPTKLPSPPSDTSKVLIHIPPEPPIPRYLIEHLHNWQDKYLYPIQPNKN